MIEEGAPCRRKLDAVNAARQQRHADCIFKISDLPAERRLSGVAPSLEVDNYAMAISLVASTRGVALLPASARNFLPWSVVSRPLKGEVPTIDLAVGYHKANTSPILKSFLSRMDELITTKSGKTAQLPTDGLIIGFSRGSQERPSRRAVVGQKAQHQGGR